MVHRTYTFHSIELQVGMSSAIASQKYEDWLVSRFTTTFDEFDDKETLHCKNHIDFRGKPHMAYDFIGVDGCKNYVVLCGESTFDLRDCLLKFMELSSQQYVENNEHIQDTIKW